MNTPTHTPQQDLIGSDTRLRIGQVWMVRNRAHWYLAEVLGFVGDRIQIRAICPRNVTATPTLAKRTMFNNSDYWFVDGSSEATC